MNQIWKRRISILASIVLAFVIACSSRLMTGSPFSSFFVTAEGLTYANVGTASLEDDGDTVFIRMAEFNVGTEEDPEIRYCSGYTVGDFGSEENPTANVDMSSLTPIWPDAPLTGTLDKDIYICSGSFQADLYVDGLTLTEGHTITAVSPFDVKMGELTVGEIVAPTAQVWIGDKASVTVNGDASVGTLHMYKPGKNIGEGQADPAVYNPDYLGGTLYVAGDLTGSSSSSYCAVDNGSSLTVDGDVSGFNYSGTSISVYNGSQMAVGGNVSTSGTTTSISIVHSAIDVGGDMSSGTIAFQDLSDAATVGGNLSAPQTWLLGTDNAETSKTTLTVGGTVSASTVLYISKCATMTANNVNVTNLWVSGTGSGDAAKTALIADGKVSVAYCIDINRCGMVTADDVSCDYLTIQDEGPNFLDARTFECTSQASIYRNGTLDISGDCTISGYLFNIQGNSHLNVGGDLVISMFLDVQDNSSVTAEGNTTFTGQQSNQLQVFGSGVMTCKGDLSARGCVSALRGGTINVDGTLSTEQSVHSMSSGSTISAAVMNASGDINAMYGGKIAVAGKISAASSLSVNAIWGGSEITAGMIDTAGCVCAIGEARITTTGSLTTGNLNYLGVLAIGDGAVVEADSISAPYLNALGYYNDWNNGYYGKSGTSLIKVKNDANLTYWAVTNDEGTISVGRDLNCESFVMSRNGNQWDPEKGGWIHVGRDMRYSMNNGCIDKGELTVGRDFINTATRTSLSDGLAVFGGKLNVGRNVEFGSLLLNTQGDNTLLNVTGRINANRITDIIPTDDKGTRLTLHTVDPFPAAGPSTATISYTQPWYTQYVMLADENGNSYVADVSDMSKIAYPVVATTSISIGCELNGKATWKYGAPCAVGYSGMSFTLPTGKDMVYANGVNALTGWSTNPDGSGKVYTPGQSITLTEDSTFYARWSYTSIAKAKVTLAQTSYTFDGKAKTPAVKTVVLGEKTLTAGTDYTVSYRNNVQPGTAMAVVTGKGGYEGTATATFAITLAKPKLTTNGYTTKSSMDARWGKVAGAKSYELQYRVAGGSWKSVTTTGTSKTVKGLKSGQLYEVRVRATAGKVKGPWSGVSRRYFGGVSGVKAKSRKAGTVTASWKKDSKANGGYEVLVRYQKGGAVVAKTSVAAGKTTATVTGLAKGRKVWVEVRPLRKSGGSTYVGVLHGAWGKA